MKYIYYGFAVAASACLAVAAWQKWLPLSQSETWGFITGGWCVWLTVKENIWNWPIGIANSIFFAVLFFDARLYADMGLQVVYILLGILGWYWWLYGGKDKTELAISRTPLFVVGLTAVTTALATWALTLYLRSVHDAAPFLDALTTTLSLAAQYLLTKKYLENWLVWISADVIYIGLYYAKGLRLTSLLYFVFLCMCLAGLRSWRRDYNVATQPTQREEAYV